MATLELNGITKAYGKKIAIQNFSARFENGIYGLLGPNGAGKSTLINIIAGVLKSDSGSIFLNGNDIRRFKNSYYDHIGFMPQHPSFYANSTAMEIMKYMAALNNVKDNKRICELLSFVNLISEKDRIVGGFSGGMKQRLAIASALINNPEVLILDEPTAGLDPKERVRFRNIISQISNDRIIIFATHIASDVELIADKIILIDSGELVDIGTAMEICEGLKGKVWQLIAENNRELSEYKKALNITSVINNGRYEIKCICDNPPSPDAIQVAAGLDDVFLYRFSDKG